jgi:type VI secretion system ImpM family protein
MPYGLFGKVPQKRDFMSVQMPTAVLSPFETWLQSGVAASRNELGQAWQEHYLVAPIWRFWIGRHILGTTVAGALMPSVDQVGRYFPLSIMYFADDADYLPPPLLSPLDHWYAAIEQRLLGALSEETDAYLTTVLLGLEPPFELVAPPPEPPVIAEATPPADAEVSVEGDTEAGNDPPDAPVPEPQKTAIEDLPDTSPFDDFAAPRSEPANGPVTLAFKGGHTMEVPAGETMYEALALLRDADYGHASEGRSYFWCGPSRAGPARVHGRQGLPDPYFFSRMILWERGPQ